MIIKKYITTLVIAANLTLFINFSFASSTDALRAEFVEALVKIKDARLIAFKEMFPSSISQKIN